MTPIRKMKPVLFRVSRVPGKCLASGGLIDSWIEITLCYNVTNTGPRMPTERAGMSKGSKRHRRKRGLVMGGCIAALAIVPASAQTADPTRPVALPSVTHALDPLTVTARRITRDDLYIADEAFFTGTAAEVTPIREVDSRVIGAGKTGPITARLQTAFFDIVNGKNDKYRQWLAPVAA